MKLTDTACKNAKPREKPYKIFDGGGLYLLTKPNGSKLWRFKYRFLGKEKLLAIGPYPTISLAEARETREKARKLLLKHPPQDPMLHKQEVKLNAIKNAQNTFKAVAKEWHNNQVDRWTRGYAQKVNRCLEMNIFPYIGNRPVAEIEPPELLECLRKIEKRGAFDIAGRAKQICGQVFRYGVQTGKCKRDPSVDLKGALKTRKTKHFRTLEPEQIPELLSALNRNEANLYDRTIRATWLSLYTFCRPIEIRMARWEEVSLEESIWRIPAERMKMRKDHIVPLSRQALQIFKEQKEEIGYLKTEWVFPSQISLKRPMSDGTVNKAIKLLGFGNVLVAHGFRALARTTIREKLKFDSEIIERQLAHKASGPLGEAYDRTQFIEERTKMMQIWADYLDSLQTNGKVIVGQFG
ncbi:MAG: tyrosine-type recombinase/integrase [Alphaproteobacteria bacterium]|nr:tyrosine-type recombinase/integrase [Alphaproteobacteria bacterium]